MNWNGKALISTTLIVVSAVLAFLGYAEMLTRPEFGLNGMEIWLESLLLTGGLMVWPFLAPPLGLQRYHDIPLMLEIARFLLPLGVFLGALLVLGRVFGGSIRAFLVRFARNHVVVCAEGADAWQFVNDLRREHRDRFVVLDLHANRGTIQERPPVAILPAAEGVDERLLLNASVHRARAIVALGNEDMRGLETVLRAKAIAARHRPGHMTPLMGRAAIAAVSAGEATEALFGVHNATFSFRPISIARNIVRMLLQAHPLDRDPTVRQGGRLHVRIVGFGPLGQELALEVARGGHFIDERPPLISIVDPAADALFARLAQSRPELGKAADFRLLAADVENLQAWDDPVKDEAPSRTVICLKAGILGLQIAATLSQRALTAGSQPGPIFVDLAHAPVAAEMLADTGRADLAQSIVPFGDAAALFTRDVILEETLDQLAREIHEHYRENRTTERKAGAAVVADLPWHELPERFRDANRHQADHILPKLRAIGCEPVPAAGAPAFAFRPEELELLAHIEHRRWNAERRVAGWRYAPVRRDEAREHPSLVSWDSLSESERDKDRQAVAAIPDILARVGVAIRRRPEPSP